MKRVIIDILLFVFLFILPWWLIFAILIVLIFYFDRFYEVVAASLILDFLYNTQNSLFFFNITAASVISLIAIEWLKKRLRIYA